jgi:hypothetical protein
MRKWIVLGIGVFVLHVLGLFLTMPTPRWVIWGFLRGEPFYKGRPVCWWKDELQDWVPEAPLASRLSPYDFSSDDEAGIGLFPNPELDLTGWVIRRRTSVKRTNEWLNKLIKTNDRSLPFLDGDTKAVPVLRELLLDEDPTILRIAMTGLRRAGLSASIAITSVEPLTHHPDRAVRREARHTLCSLGAFFVVPGRPE